MTERPLFTSILCALTLVSAFLGACPEALRAQSPSAAPAASAPPRALPVTPSASPATVPRATAAGETPASPPAGAPDASAAKAISGGTNGSTYVVAPEDVVTIRVFREDDLQTVARVSKDGVVNFPLIGVVNIGGKTPDDSARLIAGELAKGYLVSPQVTLEVTEYARRHYTVLGQVQKPGSYDMPDRNTLTLLEAIGAAGGYTRIADPAKIQLKRLDNGKDKMFKLNAKDMANSRNVVNFEIKPGDIITVGETFF